MTEKPSGNLINPKFVKWSQDMDARFKRKDGVFGPPLFDEKPSKRNWRLFKKGFVWGKLSPSLFPTLTQHWFLLFAIARWVSDHDCDGLICGFPARNAARTEASEGTSRIANHVWACHRLCIRKLRSFHQALSDPQTCHGQIPRQPGTKRHGV